MSGHAAERYGAGVLASAGEGARLVTCDEADARPEVAWLSADLFYSDEGRRFLTRVADERALRWLQSAAAGADVPVYRSLLERGVQLSASHANAISIAEYVLGSVLGAMQGAPRWADAQRRRSWEHHEFDELSGTTWIIVGFGAIGQATAARAAAFGARIIGVRRRPGDHPLADEVIAPSELPAHLGDADVVVLARPGDPAGRALFDAALLARLKPGSILVNVARGHLIERDALIGSLSASRPAVAILDTTDPEPLGADDPLWSLGGVIITPHNAAGGRGRHERNAALFMANLERYRAGETLPDEVTLADLPAVSSPPAQFRREP